MATKTEVINSFSTLTEQEKREAAQAIQAITPLPPPPQKYVGILWLMVVGAFISVLLGGCWVLYELIVAERETEVFVPLVTAALGVLAGLLAPSPVTKSGNG